MKYSHLKYQILAVIAVSFLGGCSDDMPLPEVGSTAPIADAEKFWYSRTRSAQKTSIVGRKMLRRRREVSGAQLRLS